MDWLRIHVSNLCNFKCPNCHVFELSENNLPNRVMSEDVFNTSVEQFVSALKLKNHTEARISIYGGETLANKKVIFAGIAHFGNNFQGIKLHWIVNTNGSLMTEDDVIFMKNHSVEIHISVDGKEEIHNLSRPTHKGKGTFHMVVPALEFIKKHHPEAQINSYMMPSNVKHLESIVDIAEKYEIKKIYLDQFYNLEMISHQVGMERYRQVFYYALEKGIKISGPWEKVLRRIERNINREDELENVFAVDVNVDGSIYFPIIAETKNETLKVGDLYKFFKSNGWETVTQRARVLYHKSCQDCPIKDKCLGTAIEQVHYHVGLNADTKVSCDFFRDWMNFLQRPVYIKPYPKLEVFSMIPLEKVDSMISTLNEEVERLEERLWPLKEKIILNISEFPEEFRFASKQRQHPDWVKALTVGEKYFFHLGAHLTPAAVHELTHLFLAQEKFNLPIWFAEGVCEWIADQTIDEEQLRNSINRKNLVELIEAHKDTNGPVSFLRFDENIPSRNPYYLQAKAFVASLEHEWGKNGLIKFLYSTKDHSFEDSFLIAGHKPFEEHLNIIRIQNDALSGVKIPKNAIYKLHLKDQSGVVRVALYNPYRSTIIWQDNGEPVIELTEKSYDHVLMTSPNFPVGKSRALQKIKIQLGFACNYSCSYCSQNHQRAFPKDSSQEILLKVPVFLKKMNSWFDGGEDGQGLGVQLEFWGGETLLYWQALVVMARELRSRYPNIKLALFTNGSIITKEMAQIALDLKIHFIISHDGPTFTQDRAKDPLDIPEQREPLKFLFETLSPYNLVSFNATISPKNFSFLEIQKYIATKLEVEPSKIVLTHDLATPYDSTGMTYVALEKNRHHLINALFQEFIKQYPFNLSIGRLDMILHDFFGSLATHRPAQAVGQKCSMDLPTSLAVDIDGNVLTCQNVTAKGGHKIGHIDQYSEVKLNTAYHWSEREECRRCPVVQLCKGACMFLEDKLWTSACDQHFTWSLAYMALAFYLQTNCYLVKIEGVAIRKPSETSIDVLEV